MTNIDRLRLPQVCAIAAACVLLAGCPSTATQPTSMAGTTSAPSTSSATGTSSASGSKTATSTPTTLVSVTLSWNAPALNTNGSILNDLAGYHIDYGTSATAMNQTVNVYGAATTTYKVTKLSPGTYYFAVVAYTSLGTQSAPSQTVSAKI